VGKHLAVGEFNLLSYFDIFCYACHILYSAPPSYVAFPRNNAICDQARILNLGVVEYRTVF